MYNFRKGSHRLLGTIVLIVAIAASLVWVYQELQLAFNEDQAITTIINSGGVVLFDCGDTTGSPQAKSRCAESAFRTSLRRVFGNRPFGRVKFVLCGPSVTRETMDVLDSMPALVSIAIIDTTLDKEFIERLGKMKRVVHWHFGRCQFVGNAYAELQSLRQIETVQFSPDKFSLIGLEGLAALPNLTRVELLHATVDLNRFESHDDWRQLKYLSLKNSRFVGEFSSLSGLSNLRYLDLEGIAVSDDHIDSLIKLKGLRELTVNNTRISTSGAAKLARALPNCRVFSASQ